MGLAWQLVDVTLVSFRRASVSQTTAPTSISLILTSGRSGRRKLTWTWTNMEERYDAREFLLWIHSILSTRSNILLSRNISVSGWSLCSAGRLFLGLFPIWDLIFIFQILLSILLSPPCLCITSLHLKFSFPNFRFPLTSMFSLLHPPLSFTVHS